MPQFVGFDAMIATRSSALASFRNMSPNLRLSNGRVASGRCDPTEEINLKRSAYLERRNL